MGRKGKSRAAPWRGSEREERQGRSGGDAAVEKSVEKRDERIRACRVASLSPNQVAPASGTRES